METRIVLTVILAFCLTVSLYICLAVGIAVSYQINLHEHVVGIIALITLTIISLSISSIIVDSYIKGY